MIEKKIFSCLKMIFKKEKIPKKITNLEYGSFKSWDSLSHLNLLLTIERKFKIKFALNEMYELSSVKEIIESIEKKLK